MTGLISIKALVVTAIVAYVVHSLVEFVQRRRIARKFNCQDPPILKNRLPLGLDQIHRALKTLDSKSFPVDFQARCEEMGAVTYGTNLLGKYGIFTADEENIHAVLVSQFPDFELGDVRANNFYPFLGPGIFSHDGKDWERDRALLRPQFLRSNLNDIEMEERHFQRLLTVLGNGTSQPDGWTGKVDLLPLFFRLTLDSATEFLLGESVNSLVPSKERIDDEDFCKWFDKGNESLGARALYFQYGPWIYPKGFRKAIKLCHRFIDKIVHKELATKMHVKPSDTEKKDNERYVFLNALMTQNQNPYELRSHCLNILIAGRDTTADTLGWLFWELVRQPDIYGKLRQIVIQTFGTYQDCAPTTDITYAKLTSCTYLQHCLNETLRMYPPVPYNLRKATCDTTLPRGGGPDGKGKIFIPKGTQVDYSPYVLQRRQDIWGSDAEKFIPERWEGRKSGGKEFIPFNAGPRVCIGQQYGLTEMGFMTVRLLQRFDKMENMDEDPVARHKYSLTSCSANGVKVKLHRASSA